jgi:hypothetical protein
MRRKFPAKANRLTPDQLGELFAGILAYDYSDPSHPGIPLSPEKRLAALQAMSVADMEKTRLDGFKRDSERYERATGYKITETIPWVHGLRLITGSRWSGSGTSRLRRALRYGVVAHAYLPESDEAPARKPMDETAISALIEHHQAAGFTRGQLLSFARVVSESLSAQAAEARVKNFGAREKSQPAKKIA